jgi:hypothetical protein
MLAGVSATTKKDEPVSFATSSRDACDVAVYNGKVIVLLKGNSRHKDKHLKHRNGKEGLIIKVFRRICGILTQ